MQLTPRSNTVTSFSLAITVPLSLIVSFPFLRTLVVLVQGVAPEPNDNFVSLPDAWVVLLVSTSLRSVPSVHVSEMPALRANVVPGLIVAWISPVYSVPAENVRIAVAEALLTNAISDAAATMSSPIILG